MSPTRAPVRNQRALNGRGLVRGFERGSSAEATGGCCCCCCCCCRITATTATAAAAATDGSLLLRLWPQSCRCWPTSAIDFAVALVYFHLHLNSKERKLNQIRAECSPLLLPLCNFSQRMCLVFLRLSLALCSILNPPSSILHPANATNCRLQPKFSLLLLFSVGSVATITRP